MTEFADIVAAQVGFLAAEVFLVGLYVQRRFILEGEVRARVELVEAQADSGELIEAAKGHRNLEDYLAAVRPWGSLGNTRHRRLLRYGSNLIEAFVVTLYLTLWWVALERAGATHLRWPWDDRADLSAYASSLLATVTIFVLFVGWVLLRGRSRVINGLRQRSREVIERSATRGPAPNAPTSACAKPPSADGRSERVTHAADLSLVRVSAWFGFIAVVYWALRLRLRRRPT